VLKRILNTVYRGFSVFGLTQQEAYFVLLVILLSLIGSGITMIKPYTESRAVDSKILEKIETFKYFSDRVQSDRFAIFQRDSLAARFAGDSASLKHWKNQADSIQKFLAHRPPREALDSVLDQLNDVPVKTVNINEADVSELNSLPGIGPKLAGRIIDYRTKNGSFHSPDEIQKVRGIGKKMFAKIKPFIDIQ
jgi:comEA protein